MSYFDPDSYTSKNQIEDMLRYGNDVVLLMMVLL